MTSSSRATPSCRGGRFTVADDVFNPSEQELHDHQVEIQIPVAQLIVDRKLQAGAGDLRFASGGELLAHVVEDQTAWIRMRRVPVGTSTIDMYYGNALARDGEGSVFLASLIANASFEQQGGWTIDPSAGQPAGFYFGDRTWSSDGPGALLVTLETSGDRLESTRSSISQPTSFPGGSYVLRFDINIIAASNGGLDGASDGSFAITLGNGVNNLWALGGDVGNITGPRRNVETAPFSGGAAPLGFQVNVMRGNGPGYAKAHLDHLRVRKHVSPEPVARLGDEASLCDP